MTFNDLEKINDFNIEKLSKLDNDKAKAELETQRNIKKVLSKNIDLFFNISEEDAKKILSNLVPDDEIDKDYEDLTSPEEFKRIFNPYAN